MIKRVYLEITDSCNLNCPFCRVNKGNHFMSLEEIEDYLDKIKPVCDYIYLHVLGEPLLHPDFEKILDLLDGKGFKLQLVTNGTLLHKYPDLMSHKCLRKLSVSLHSVNNLDIGEDYFRCIDALIENTGNAAVELRFYDYERLDERLKTYLEELKERYSFELTSRKNSYRLKDKLYVYFEKLFKWPDINDPFVSEHGKCQGGISQLAVLHNGDVTLCCLDPKGINKTGNLKDSSLESILESDRYRQIVSDMHKHLFTEELCRHCTYHLRFSKQ